MVRALSVKEEWDFIPREDKAELEKAEKNGHVYEPTVFHLSRLTVEDEAWLTDLASRHGGLIPMGTVSARLCRRYIKGWENFCDVDGRPISPSFEKEGKRQVLTDVSLSVMPRDLKTQITNNIIESGNLSEEDLEKFEPPSTSRTEKSEPDALSAATQG